MTSKTFVNNSTPAVDADWLNDVNEFVYHRLLIGNSTYDAPSLVDGAGATTSVTVTGAELGDFALASLSINTQGITITANVTATDTVTVRFQNETGSTVDLVSSTLYCLVVKRTFPPVG